MTSGRRRKAEGEPEGTTAEATAVFRTSEGTEYTATIAPASSGLVSTLAGADPDYGLLDPSHFAATSVVEEGKAERKPDFMWSGQPVFQCRLCGDQYERVNNLPAVLDHERSQHPTNARQSHVLGPDGRPLIVVD